MAENRQAEPAEDPFRHLLRDVMTAHSDVCLDIVGRGLGPGRAAVAAVQHLRNNLAEHIRTEANYSVAMNDIRKLKEELSGKDLTLEELDEAFRSHEERPKEVISEVDIAKHEMFKRFEASATEKLFREADEAEGDLVATVMVRCTVDPFTKMEMKDPVKNTICGHAYEKRTILSLISKKPTLCPYPGCINTSHISKDILQTDWELKQIISGVEK